MASTYIKKQFKKLLVTTELKWTFSAWIKKVQLGSRNNICYA